VRGKSHRLVAQKFGGNSFHSWCGSEEPQIAIPVSLSLPISDRQRHNQTNMEASEDRCPARVARLGSPPRRSKQPSPNSRTENTSRAQSHGPSRQKRWRRMGRTPRIALEFDWQVRRADFGGLTDPAKACTVISVAGPGKPRWCQRDLTETGLEVK
jgi:hypothetical protein